MMYIFFAEDLMVRRMSVGSFFVLSEMKMMMYETSVACSLHHAKGRLHWVDVRPVQEGHIAQKQVYMSVLHRVVSMKYMDDYEAYR